MAYTPASSTATESMTSPMLMLRLPVLLLLFFVRCFDLLPLLFSVNYDSQHGATTSSPQYMLICEYAHLAIYRVRNAAIHVVTHCAGEGVGLPLSRPERRRGHSRFWHCAADGRNQGKL